MIHQSDHFSLVVHNRIAIKVIFNSFALVLFTGDQCLKFLDTLLHKLLFDLLSDL